MYVFIYKKKKKINSVGSNVSGILCAPMTFYYMNLKEMFYFVLFHRKQLAQYDGE